MWISVFAYKVPDPKVNQPLHTFSIQDHYFRGCFGSLAAGANLRRGGCRWENQLHRDEQVEVDDEDGFFYGMMT